MNAIEEFKQEKKKNIELLGDDSFKQLGVDFVQKTALQNYSYNFEWLGRPIIQFPQDMVALQEIIWNVKPDLIIETGIAHGGSLIFSSSMLMLLEGCNLIENGRVLGIDIDIREHNKQAILEHPLSTKITMIEGSSIEKSVIDQVHAFAKGAKTILVLLDSNHTHEHVLKELEAYSALVTNDSYCIVYDTGIEDMPEDSFPNRPWGKGNNPKTAVLEFLSTNDNFQCDYEIENKLLITVAPNGYLRKIK